MSNSSNFVIKLESKHPLLQMAPKVREVSEAFFNTHGFNYFQYLRCYKDGNISLLLSDPSLFLKFIHIETPLIFSSFKENHAPQQSYWFLWDEELSHAPIKLAKEEHQWHHGLTLVKRHRDYYDMIAVAMAKDCPNAASYYMNRMPAIEQFMTGFSHYAPHLFKTMLNNPILLPKENRDPNYQQLCLPKDNRLQFGDVYITAQELKCLTLKLQGCSYKEIANAYQLSPRTVETYLNRIKVRSGISNKSQLQELINFCK